MTTFNIFCLHYLVGRTLRTLHKHRNPELAEKTTGWFTSSATNPRSLVPLHNLHCKSQRGYKRTVYSFKNQRPTICIFLHHTRTNGCKIICSVIGMLLILLSTRYFTRYYFKDRVPSSNLLLSKSFAAEELWCYLRSYSPNHTKNGPQTWRDKLGGRLLAQSPSVFIPAW